MSRSPSLPLFPPRSLPLQMHCAILESSNASILAHNMVLQEQYMELVQATAAKEEQDWVEVQQISKQVLEDAASKAGKMLEE